MQAHIAVVVLACLGSLNAGNAVEAGPPFKILAQQGSTLPGANQQEPLGPFRYATVTQSGDLYLICQGNPAVSTLVGGKLVPLIQDRIPKLKGSTGTCLLKLESRPGYGGNSTTVWGPDSQLAEFASIEQQSPGAAKSPSQAVVWWGMQGGRVIDIPVDSTAGTGATVTLRRVEEIVFVDSNTIAFSGTVYTAYRNGTGGPDRQLVWIARTGETKAAPFRTCPQSPLVWVARTGESKAEAIFDASKPPGEEQAKGQTENRIVKLMSNQSGNLVFATSAGRMWAWHKSSSVPHAFLGVDKMRFGGKGSADGSQQPVSITATGQMLIWSTTYGRGNYINVLKALDPSGIHSDVMESFDVDPSPESGPQAFRWSDRVTLSEPNRSPFRTDGTGKHLAYVMDELYSGDDGKVDDAKTESGLYVGTMPTQLDAALRLYDPVSRGDADSMVGSITDVCVGNQGDIWILGTYRRRELGAHDASHDVQGIWHRPPGGQATIVLDVAKDRLVPGTLTLVGAAKSSDGGGVYAQVQIPTGDGGAAWALVQVNAN